MLRAALLVRALVAPALVLSLAACSRDGQAEADPAASSSPTGPAATEPAVTGYPEGVDATDLTEPGESLDFGDTASVAWRIGGGEVGMADLRVEEVREVTLKEFRGWLADDSMKDSTPYFVDVRVENTGETDLGGLAVPVLLLDSNGVLGPPWAFGGTFRPCNSGPLPKTFEPGEKRDVCLVYLAPQGATIDAMAFSPVDGFEPIRWTGDVETPEDEKKKRRKKR